MGNEPFKAPRIKLYHYLAAAGCFLLSLLCVFAYFGYFDWYLQLYQRGEFVALVLAGVFAYLSYVLLRRSQYAYEIEKEELDSKIEIKSRQMLLKEQLVRERQVEDQAARDIALNNVQRDTAVAVEITNQKILATSRGEQDLRQYLTRLAADQGITPDTLVDINTRKYLDDLELQTERKRMNIEVDKKRQLNEADLETELRKMEEQVKLALVAKHLGEAQKISQVQKTIDGILRQIDDLKQDSVLSDGSRKQLIAHREEIILTLVEHRRGRQKRLLESDNG